MQKVTVHASRDYEILIGGGLLHKLGQETAKCVRGRYACIVSESNVYPLHGTAAEESLKNAGFRVISYVFPAGERSKNGENYLALLNFLAEHQITRGDVLIALGGGVVGDLTGFAAATFLRGIAFVQVPTTLLAAVDSSVGGKTAIDLPMGKNLAGCFYQPHLVLCDTDTLQTLPREIFLDGCAEVIKYGILYDKPFFELLRSAGADFDRETVIRRCVELKRDVVAQDEFDTGARMKLNLGHTVGHGVEAKSCFAVSHGKAVAIGTAVVSRAAARSGMLAPADAEAIVSTLRAFGLPTSTAFTAQELAECMLSDKKRSGGSVNLIIPRQIGRCDIVPTPVEKLEAFVQMGL